MCCVTKETLPLLCYDDCSGYIVLLMKIYLFCVTVLLRKLCVYGVTKGYLCIFVLLGKFCVYCTVLLLRPILYCVFLSLRKLGFYCVTTGALRISCYSVTSVYIVSYRG